MDCEIWFVIMFITGLLIGALLMDIVIMSRSATGTYVIFESKEDGDYIGIDFDKPEEVHKKKYIMLRVNRNSNSAPK